MKLPDDNEVSIVGKWIFKSDGSVDGDENCNRIDWLTESVFEFIKADGDTWSALYKNPHDEKYWESTYPQSHLHGGGPMAIEVVKTDFVKEKYKIDIPD